MIYHEFPASGIWSEGAASKGLNLLERINSSCISQRAEIVFYFYIKIGLKKGKVPIKITRMKEKDLGSHPKL